MNTSRARRALSAALVVTVLPLGLAACGGSDDAGRPAAARTASNGDVFNPADVDFAQQMIPHHAQAVQMVQMVRHRPLDPAVRRLAEQIRDAQVPEIQTMVGWLDDWDEKVPPTANDHMHADMKGMGGMEGMSDGPGMMSAEDMTALSRASDSEFQDMWLTMMIHHHEGAIEMARREVASGTFAGALSMARGIESSQQQEIDTMRGMLD